MGIKLVISFLFQDFFCFPCARFIFICVSDAHCLMHFIFCMPIYANKTETFHYCTTIQSRATIFSRYSMGAKDKQRVWEDVNYHGNMSFFH